MSWIVAGLIEPQFESNDVLWMAFVQDFLPGCIDDVIGRRHYLFDISDDSCIVPRAMKRKNRRHSEILYSVSG
jgi:hypothetical protein